MCRWLAYQGVPCFLDEMLHQPNHSLVMQSMEASKAVTAVNADGFGVAWYGEKETPALYREVLPAWSDANLHSLSRHVRSHRFMAHVRASTGTNTSRENCHPFNVDQWLFMHNGQIPAFERVRFNLERQLEEKYYLKRRGTTDSELVFLLLLQDGLAASPKGALKRVIARVEAELRAKGIVEPFKASLCMSDGTKFWGLRYASTGVPPTLFFKPLDGGVVLASEPYESDIQHWNSVPAQSFIELNGEHVDITQFDMY
ncbi:class II glutamine amidotransferase [Grimontia hollisae]|uniref:Glutamine amidotransferases class-II n=2 Tax=Grimontia hollisae TaxID=673 RepID=D0IA44_GRIHO|nr:class II glutamine amidotransferase [Grimontia hollisae]EEY70762.1 glutamine amidotransferases class-II [Grimontia hollisae CIP 101886]MDF2186128.1 class II glutamine amidotransferase [Grimontia hollisae]STO44872.1 Amidohydrolase EgtC [Grimontia hollisae]STO57644.1 Amidohydrolase EgtC [Grimontia hollisae]STQ75425.1 Amidohydrolase EgtC [Grimontia hollisae]